MAMQPHKVFLSYPGGRNEDLYAVMREVLDSLPRTEVIDWPEMQTGEYIGPRIFAKLREASLVVIVINDDHHQVNENVLVEFGAAVALQQPVVPIAETRIEHAIPIDLRDIARLQYVDRDLVTEAGRAAFKSRLQHELETRLERLIVEPATQPAARGDSDERRQLLASQAQIHSTFARLSWIKGLERQIALECRRIKAMTGAGEASEAAQAARELVRRMRALVEVREDAGLLLWRSILGFVALAPLLWLLLGGLREVGLLSAEIAALDTRQIFVGLVYAFGPLLLAIPAARHLARVPGSFGLLGLAVVPVFGAWCVLSFLLVRDGWPAVLAWQTDEKAQMLLLRGTVLGSVLSVAIIGSLRHAALTLGRALRNSLVTTMQAAVAFLALRLALVFVLEPHLFTSTTPSPETFMVAAGFGTAILVAFVAVITLALQAPWLGRRGWVSDDASNMRYSQPSRLAVTR